jgi:hypothetical protein
MQTLARQVILATLMTVSLLGAHSTLAQAADPLHGTWKLNAAKSQFDPGPAPKSVTVTFAPAGEGVKVTADVVGADDKATHTSYTGNYDGKDYPITGSNTGAETVSLKRIDAATTQRIDKKGGKVVMTFTRKVSTDGKTLTVTVHGTNAKGQAVNDVVMFTKQ